ncbi:MAG: 4-hydroxythreonine-4-phosphate dehydrogenase PdxA [Alphaproteobacteria bacterium]|jgi:4-hydroxy-L-threonine phosphate dehydrogenase PdxA|nr:4-hydroxythreonine-4-phosphate dehydrogenase PdxA [Alphaproteobacteria bacterium]MBU1560159.1 4-hydroxythreonine-4-phosphate dehydrogenase PdxA [Alphaproteobacteria bacterium]MBU2301897.1 4-hydroxythreonine-4-phosphate dehydrogenase PdxA [Alphaproteobacteria bacterium]MBU2367119.1 4-hydroxythreonine-4-phosphate dehydrogenase PdxA [Alphaproteobacteria bacterium]
MKPRLAVVLGDPAGIGPELVAKLLAKPENREKADILLIADRDEVEEGMRIAGQRFSYQVVSGEVSFGSGGGILLEDFTGSAKRPFQRATSTESCGRYCLETLERAVDLTRAGVTDGVLFTPLNKNSMHQAGLPHEDESQWFAAMLGVTGPHGELNALDNLWTSRVTSHVALKDVSGLITKERVIAGIELAHKTLVAAGVARPRIGVCGLNPHNGENGSFGREEIDVIGPAVEEARSRGLPASGPFPADTIFLRVKDFDAIVTMYHDQGQIAMKLMGFSRGVTVHGGLPIPIATPAHGTAFDIYGQGKANLGATQAAFDIVVAQSRSRNRIAA